MRMRMRMKIVKVNDKGGPTPFFCVLTYSDLQSKNVMIQRTGSKEDGERIVCSLVGLIGRPWEGILNIENIASPFIEWLETMERILPVYGYEYLRADANGFSILILLISSIPIYDTLAHYSPP